LGGFDRALEGTVCGRRIVLLMGVGEREGRRGQNIFMLKYPKESRLGREPGQIGIPLCAVLLFIREKGLFFKVITSFFYFQNQNIFKDIGSAKKEREDERRRGEVGGGPD
jgi:hypothetical protein